jgi:cytosine/adenosine deaminase-related metal-dependent hydrolase
VVTKIIVEGAYVLTNDAARSEYAGGHVVIEDNLIIAVGPGPDVYVVFERLAQVATCAGRQQPTYT